MGASQSQAILRHIDRRFDLLESDIKLLIEERNGHTRPRESRTNEKRFKAFFENALFDTNVVTRSAFETHGLFDIEPPVIYVRDDFKLFHQIIKEIRSSASKGTIGMIIKGNPGIGKSVFFLYEILWLIREKKNFAYSNPMKELMVYVNFQDQEGEQLRFFKTFDLLKEKIDRRKTVLLFDNTSRSIPAIEFSGFDCIVFCSSPGMSYTILERQLGSRISSRLMSAWETEELEQMKKACSLKVDVLQEYEEIGGLPRLLLDTKGYCDTKKRIAAAIKRSIPLIDQLFDYISLPVDSMMLRAAPHELIHAFHTDKTCGPYEFRWATRTIESRYVKEKSKSGPEKVKKLLKSVDEASTTRKIVGEFYEKFVHYHIMEGLLTKATAKLLEKGSTSSSRNSLDTTASSNETVSTSSETQSTTSTNSERNCLQKGSPTGSETALLDLSVTCTQEIPRPVIAEAEIARILDELLAQKQQSESKKSRKDLKNDASAEACLNAEMRVLEAALERAKMSGKTEKVYLKPAMRNFPGIDSMLLPDTLFQVTISKRHSTNKIAMSRIVNVVQRIFGVETVKLVYIVPSSSAKEWKTSFYHSLPVKEYLVVYC